MSEDTVVISFVARVNGVEVNRKSYTFSRDFWESLSYTEKDEMSKVILSEIVQIDLSES